MITASVAACVADVVVVWTAGAEVDVARTEVGVAVAPHAEINRTIIASEKLRSIRIMPFDKGRVSKLVTLPTQRAAFDPRDDFIE